MAYRKKSSLMGILTTVALVIAGAMFHQNIKDWLVKVPFIGPMLNKTK